MINFASGNRCNWAAASASMMIALWTAEFQSASCG